MFAPGEESMAELTYAEAEAIREGRKKRGRHRLMYDHRWGECADLTNEVELRMALREAYGDAMLWIDLDGLVDEFYDLRNEAADSRRYFLNAKTSASDAWIADHEWNACKRPGQGLKRGDFVTLGLDGSRKDDATALVACRIGDGHIELLGLWERPEGPEAEGWQVDRDQVDAAVANAMNHFDVAGFYCDPPHWQDYVDAWTREYGEKMQVRATAQKPLEWWTNRPTAMVATLERFFQAVQDRTVGFTPPEDRAGREEQLALGLTRHVLNARRREGRAGLTIHKESPKSARKIDAAMAAVLSYECARDAIAQGAKPSTAGLIVPRRLR